MSEPGEIEHPRLRRLRDELEKIVAWVAQTLAQAEVKGTDPLVGKLRQMTSLPSDQISARVRSLSDELNKLRGTLAKGPDDRSKMAARAIKNAQEAFPAIQKKAAELAMSGRSDKGLYVKKYQWYPSSEPPEGPHDPKKDYTHYRIKGVKDEPTTEGRCDENIVFGKDQDGVDRAFERAQSQGKFAFDFEVDAITLSPDFLANIQDVARQFDAEVLAIWKSSGSPPLISAIAKNKRTAHEFMNHVRSLVKHAHVNESAWYDLLGVIDG
jgi:hypothetical protein